MCKTKWLLCLAAATASAPTAMGFSHFHMRFSAPSIRSLPSPIAKFNLRPLKNQVSAMASGSSKYLKSLASHPQVAEARRSLKETFKNVDPFSAAEKMLTVAVFLPFLRMGGVGYLEAFFRATVTYLLATDIIPMTVAQLRDTTPPYPLTDHPEALKRWCLATRVKAAMQFLGIALFIGSSMMGMMKTAGCSLAVVLLGNISFWLLGAAENKVNANGELVKFPAKLKKVILTFDIVLCSLAGVAAMVKPGSIPEMVAAGAFMSIVGFNAISERKRESDERKLPEGERRKLGSAMYDAVAYFQRING